jgi:glutaconyl-CoA/methylmalonyl-CoA decarboxylase subunit gamma
MKLSIKIDEQNFMVEVGDLSSRPVRVLVDGEAFEVWPEEAMPNGSHPLVSTPPGVTRPVEVVMPPAAAGMARPAPLTPAAPLASGGKSVLAPIPGVIVSVAVKVGDPISFGQELCVLEAMKMKNLIRANRAGTVAAVQVAPGDSVKHSQVLIEFSD